jgi:hypothetical protein
VAAQGIHASPYAAGFAVPPGSGFLDTLAVIGGAGYR